MAEAQQPGSPTPPATPAAQPAAPTLDTVVKDYGIEDAASSFQPQSPQPAQPTPPQTPKVPDPFSPEFPLYQAQIQQGVSSLHQQLQQATARLSNMEKSMAAKQVEADIKQAVGTIAQKAGIDPEIAEVAFEARARQDPKLLAIWNNRHKNPKALEAATAVLASEFQQKYSVKQDPQLVENQRAVKVAQQQMATTQRQTETDKWANMSYEDRRKEAERIKRMG